MGNLLEGARRGAVLSAISALFLLGTPGLRSSTADITPTPTCDHPIDVDGISACSPDNTGTVGFGLGSFYQAHLYEPNGAPSSRAIPSGLVKSLLNAYVAQDQTLLPQVKNWDLYIYGEWALSPATLGACPQIGTVFFNGLINGAPAPLMLKINYNGLSGGVDATLFGHGLDPAGVPFSNFGGRVAFVITHLPGDILSDSPYLHYMIKFPVNSPSRFGRPFLQSGQTGIWDGTVPGPLTVMLARASDCTQVLAATSMISLGRGGVIDSDAVDNYATIDVKPGGSDNVLGSVDTGILVVAILTRDWLNAADVNPDSLMLYDADTLNRYAPNVLRPQKAQMKDVDNDGRRDLVLNFDLTKNSGAITEATTTLELTGALGNGQPLSGKDFVTVR